ncbi:hypothetical protein [Actinoplanes regularis]|uniref:NifU-like domain-containing protein n=1 Tax=Actinoplanes regularis TaxID=52697 RepID=A0A239FAL0_9ACTN|nr:hypothetical protein [Actinoplanes regularis]GIE90031.1 thioredoxin [Actinoplanes regularis]SNS53192.1 hypothetical protein SAMN06264365_117141 [Actinoplanes regularis]
MSAAAEAGRRIEELLDRLRETGDPRAVQAGEELTRTVVGLYGDGLARIAAALGAERMTGLCADPLVSSLLLVHGLHPVPVQERIRRALEGTGAQLSGIGEDGVVRLRLPAGTPGCGTAPRAIESAVRAAAPEATAVSLETPPRRPPLLQITPRPGLASR